MDERMEKLKAASGYISGLVAEKGLRLPQLLVTLGSGLGTFAQGVEKLLVIPYREIPHSPQSTVDGHAGQLVLAREPKSGENFWIMQGRVHFYEGYSMFEVVFILRTLILLGIKKFIVTNAAGGINRYFNAGDFMIIRDHINFMGTNPLIGKNLDEFGTRFPDMTNVYSRKMSILLQKVGNELDIPLKEGVYIADSGPSFETPSEIRMMERWGADAVGMSTVPEVIVAKHAGLEVAGISFISNKAAGISPTPISHIEVSENAAKAEKQFSALMARFIELVLEGKDE
ncbi:purine-nucleoside phosphorylase [bacterium]|nr:purine-nucleoside phosphorylase [bacterium]